MAKVKSSIATSLQGRIGNVSFRRAAGQRIIAAELPSLVTNPRTVAQMSQRVKLAALVAFYRASKAWQPKAWQTKQAKQSNYNAFIKANLAGNPVALTKQEAAQGATVLYPWRVAQGSLPPVSYAVSDGVYVSNIYLGQDGTIFDQTRTIADLSTALLNNNLSLRAGDQVSLIIYRQNVGSDGTPYVTCSPYEFTINTTDGRLISTRLPLDIVQVGGSSDSYSLAVDMNSVIGGFCIVISRTNGGSLEVSKADLICNSSSLYSYYTSAAHQAEAAASYGNQSEVFLDPNSETRGYEDVQVARQVLGLFVQLEGETEPTYYPAGSAGPDVLPANTQLSVKVTTTVGLASTATLTVGRFGSSEPFTVNLNECTVTDTAITWFRAVQTGPISSIGVKFEDGETVGATFERGGIEQP